MKWDSNFTETQHDENSIKGFTSQRYRWLSNFYPCKVIYMGYEFNSSEAAYQAAKCKNKEDFLKFINLSASEAKKLGRKIEIREDWEKEKWEIMYRILTSKFYINKDLLLKLKDTGDKYLEETNWWGDKYWGVCKGEGENNLGKILMSLRKTLYRKI